MVPFTSTFLFSFEFEALLDPFFALSTKDSFSSSVEGFYIFYESCFGMTKTVNE
jgi:hypothetical protein